MKDKIVIDIGKIMDEVFEAAQSFSDAVHEGFKETAKKGEDFFSWDENVDYYPAYSYPPVNVYLTAEKSLVFEFALAGFEENSIGIEFLGDYMVFSASIAEKYREKNDFRYFKHRLKFKDIKEQKYYAPADKFDQQKAEAVYKNGVLTLEIPPKDIKKQKDSVKIKVKKEE